jgi:hypothetical protein
VTVVRWETPPSRIRTPESSQEDLGQENFKRHSEHFSIGINESAHASDEPLVMQSEEEPVRSGEVEVATMERAEIDVDSSPPTPSVDDTPYIRFALDQLTRDEEVGISPGRLITGPSTYAYPVEPPVRDQGLDYYNDKRLARESIRKHRSSSSSDPEPLFRFNATRPLSPASDRSPGPEMFIPVQPPMRSSRYPPLMFVPTILRATSMITLSLLCLMMIAALMFCAIYSSHHQGLVGWSDGIWGGLYFIFGFLPQVLAAVILLYVQGVVSAITRIMPYALMAMNDADSRTKALFLGIYPKCFLWPRLDGPGSIGVANVFFWLTIFTIPLQGCLFAVIPVGGGWRWAAVQGVAWTLVAIYVLVLVATVISGVFFFRRTTGLLWDPRSLADLVVLLPGSNSLKDYPGTEVMRNRKQIEERLAMRSDRLGYWKTQDPAQGIFYCVGEEGTSTRRYTLAAGKIHEKPSNDDGFEPYQSSDVEIAADLYSRATRFRYIPWQLRDATIIFWSITAFILLLALIIISFLPSTAIRHGFLPLVPAAPDSQGFTPANFLYSFVPSVIGMLLYLLFQPLDMGLRKLQPWAELGNTDGTTAKRSLLLDYTADLPIECTLKALRRGHYRVAIVSLLSFLFILLPLLAGGLFFPLTISNDVRMMPNLPSFYILLAVLILYLIGLLILIPNRHQMRLPHSVDCLAEIFSFVYNSGILTDAAFNSPPTKSDLITRLMALSATGYESRYAFGIYRGRNGKESLGIERIGRRGAQQVLVLSGR